MRFRNTQHGTFYEQPGAERDRQLRRKRRTDWTKTHWKRLASIIAIAVIMGYFFLNGSNACRFAKIGCTFFGTSLSEMMLPPK